MRYLILPLILTLISCNGTTPEPPPPLNQESIADKLLSATQNKQIVDEVLLDIPDRYSNQYILLKGKDSADIIANRGFYLVGDYDAETNTGSLSNQSFLKSGTSPKAYTRMVGNGGDEYSWSANQKTSLEASGNAGIASISAATSYETLFKHSLKEVAIISFEQADFNSQAYWQTLINLYIGKEQILENKNYTIANVQHVMDLAEKLPIIAGATIYQSTFQEMRHVDLTTDISASELFAVSGQFYQKQGGEIREYFVRAALMKAGVIPENWPKLYADALTLYIDQNKELIALNDDIDKQQLLTFRLGQIPNNTQSIDTEAIATLQAMISAEPTLSNQFKPKLESLKQRQDQVVIDETLKNPLIEKYINNLDTTEKATFINKLKGNVDENARIQILAPMLNTTETLQLQNIQLNNRVVSP